MTAHSEFCDFKDLNRKKNLQAMEEFHVLSSVLFTVNRQSVNSPKKNL